MKKTYNELDVSIIKFENEDIVTSSGLMGFEHDALNPDNTIGFDEIFGDL